VSCQPAYDPRCCLHPTETDSASGASAFRGYLCIRLRCGPVTRNRAFDDSVDGLQVIGFPPPCHPSCKASGFCLGGIHFPLNAPAFAGRTPGRRDFPDPVGSEGISSWGLPVTLSAQAMVRIRCPRVGLLHASSGWLATDFPDSEFRSGLPLQTAFAQGSFAPEALPSFIATTSPCADPGASRLPFVLRTYRKRPCRLHHPRLVTGTVPLWSAFLSWSAAPLVPAVRRVHVTSSSPSTSAFASLRGLGSSARPPHTTASRGLIFSIRQAFLYVAALQFACPPNRSAPPIGT
jgi:hypothetical protein